MKLTQVLTHTTLTAIALFSLSLTSKAIAGPIVVNRGPNGAPHIVKSEKLPVSSQLTSNTRVWPHGRQQARTVEQKSSDSTLNLAKGSESPIEGKQYPRNLRRI